MDELNDNKKPVTWADELTELIARKRAENELLKKLRDVVGQTENDPGDTTGSFTGTRTDR